MKKAVFVVLALLFVSWLVIPSVGFTTVEFSKKEGKSCTTCHVKPAKGDENLNDVGKCYKEKKGLKTCEKK